MTDQLLDTPLAPEDVAQSLYLAIWLAKRPSMDLLDRAARNPRFGMESDHANERDEHARSEVARILALPPGQMPAPVRNALCRSESAQSHLTHSLVVRAA